MEPLGCELEYLSGIEICIKALEELSANRSEALSSSIFSLEAIEVATNVDEESLKNLNYQPSTCDLHHGASFAFH
jgi:hypothetical protein